jgi:hypothetical protein
MSPPTPPVARFLNFQTQIRKDNGPELRNHVESREVAAFSRHRRLQAAHPVHSAQNLSAAKFNLTTSASSSTSAIP